jgi:hypothetical protein
MTMPNLDARSACRLATTHCEFSFTREELAAFVQELQAYLQANQQANTFHLQVQRQQQPPAVGQPAVINNGDPVTITVHQHPGP